MIPNQLFVKEGQYTVRLRVKDIAGNLSAPGSLTFIVDNITDLQQNQYTFTSQTPANTPLYVRIRAVDNVNNTGNWAKTTAVKFRSPTVTINATPKSAMEQNSRITYSVDLQLEDNPEAFRYIIEREGPASITPVVLTYQQLKENGFKYTDSENLIKHGQYRYSVYTENEYGVASEKMVTPDILIPNIEPDSSISGPRPIVVHTDVTFALGNDGPGR